MNETVPKVLQVGLKMRAFRGEDDYWRIRSLLREIYLLNGRRELSWHIYRWDYWYWHVNANIEHRRLEDTVFIWEAADGRIASVLNPEDKGQVFLQVHPLLHAPGIEDEMLAVAERYLAVANAQGQRRLMVWTNEHDKARQESLVRRGYVKSPWFECQRRRSLDVPLPEAPLPAGYTVRALGSAEELPARSLVSWKAFHPDEPMERYKGWQWYRNVQRAPLYRCDLDLVAVAPDGELASFCTVWLDDVTRSGAFEPVGTAPAHQRLGLGKAVMREGLRRMQLLGATLALVASTSAAAHALDASAGFAEYDRHEQWSKHLSS